MGYLGVNMRANSMLHPQTTVARPTKTRKKNARAAANGLTLRASAIAAAPSALIWLFSRLMLVTVLLTYEEMQKKTL